MAFIKNINGNLATADLSSKSYAGSSAWTVAGWFVLTDYSDWGSMFHISTTAGDADAADIEIYSVITTGQISGAANATLDSGVIAGTNTFRHCVLTYDGVGGTASKRLYVDGVERVTANGALSAQWRYFASSRATHGAANSVAENIQVYRRALTVDEISVIYRRRVPLSGCIAWYPMIGGGGYAAGRDFSGNGNDMTAGGAGVTAYSATAAIPWMGRTQIANPRIGTGLSGSGKLQRASALEARVGKTPVTALPAASGASSVWLALERGDCGDDGQLFEEVELSGSGYARVNVPAVNWAPALVGANDAAVTISTSVPVSFGPSAGTYAVWGTVTHVSAWTHATSRASQYFCGRMPLATARQVTAAGQLLYFVAGEITLAEATAQ